MPATSPPVLNGCTTEKFDRFYICLVQLFDDVGRWANKSHIQAAVSYPGPWWVGATPGGRGGIVLSSMHLCDS